MTKPKLIFKTRVCDRCHKTFVTENIKKGKVCEKCRKPAGGKQKKYRKMEKDKELNRLRSLQ